MTDDERARVPPGIYNARITGITSEYREQWYVEEIDEVIEPAGIHFVFTLALSRPQEDKEYIWCAEDSSFICVSRKEDIDGLTRFLQCFGLSREEVLDRNPDDLIGQKGEVQIIAAIRVDFGPPKTEVPTGSLIFGRSSYFPL
jgi:hypothetical protein